MKLLISTLAFVSILIFGSAQDSDNLKIEKEKIINEFHAIVSSMPSPMEELENLHNDKVKFNEHLLSSPANLKQHETDAAIAVNCGIYMVDFAYLAIYHQQDRLMEYRALAYELGFKLDAATPFQDVLAVNLEKKVKDHEALKKTIDEAITATEEFLIQNNKMAKASQILLGTWIETQYILLQSFVNDKKPSVEVKTHIKEQQVHLANLIKLIHEFNDEAGMENELEKLNMLETSFQKIHNLDEINEKIIMELKDEITLLRMDILSME